MAESRRQPRDNGLGQYDVAGRVEIRSHPPDIDLQVGQHRAGVRRGRPDESQE
jgi:hypothetical protein